MIAPKEELYKRKFILIAAILIAFCILFYGFLRLQIFEKEVYVQKSLDNSIRKIQQYPVRGMIKDRDGEILVDNRPSFSAAVIPRVVDSESIAYLVNLLDLDLDEVQAKMLKNYGFRPVIVARDITPAQIAYIEEMSLSLPGVLTLVEPKRFYPKDVFSPHIFGTVGEVTNLEERIYPHLESGDFVGKTGLEYAYDLNLRGMKGTKFVRVDASGRELGLYNPQQDVSPVHGNDLYLYLDYDLQQFAESLFVEQRGALVAIDVRNGGILALVSKPDYDPRLLTGKIDPDIWRSLQSDESHPLYSRAIQSMYPPGSTYKIVAAIAALQEGIITPQWENYCPGFFKLGRKTIYCWNHEGHGSLDLNGAIKNSCNVYFYKLGLKIGLDIWSKYSKMLRFGYKTGIDLPNESRGLVPTFEYYNRIFGENGWTRGNLANLAIGQGELLVTPLQLAQFAMILANRGVYHTPHLVDHIYNYAKRSTTDFPLETHYVTGVSNEVYDFVREGMRQVVDGGTGWLGKVPGIEMAGKTGSAQNPHGDTHAWFMAFAPYEIPEVAVAVIAENAGGGGAVAAPMARKFLEMYFYNRLIPRYVAKKDTVEAAESDSLVIPFNIQAPDPIEILYPQGMDSL